MNNSLPLCFYPAGLKILFLFFFLNDPAPPKISPLPLHAALPILAGFLGLASRKRRLRAEPFLDIAPPPLDEVGHEAVLVKRLSRIPIESRIEQPEQRSKALKIGRAHV